MIEAKSLSVPIDLHSINSLINSNNKECSKYPFREAIGSLMFLTQLTRPDIIFAVNFLSRYLSNFSEIHWLAVKRIFRYLIGTADYGISYCKSKEDLSLIDYSDADYAGDIETRRSTTGYIFTLAEGSVSWCSRRQKCVSVSTTEAEYVAASMATRDLVWLRQLLSDLQCQCIEATPLMIDNQSAIKLVKNPELHNRTKHIDIHFYFIRDKYKENVLSVNYVRSEEQCADVYTKALTKERFKYLINKVGINVKRAEKALE